MQGSYLFLTPINKLGLKIVYQLVNKVIFVNKVLYDQHNEKIKKKLCNKYEVIFNAIEIKTSIEENDILKKYSIDEDKLIVFNPARLEVEKNQIRLISAIKILSIKHNNILLLIAGNGSQLKSLELYIKEKNVENHVRLLNVISRADVFKLYDKSRVFVMPSISEGLSTAFLEALQRNMKIVVSDIEQFTYPLLKNNLNIKDLNINLVDQFSEEDIANGIEQMLYSDIKQIPKFFPFTLNIMLLEYSKVYKSLLD